jgi:hypothetical protein
VVQIQYDVTKLQADEKQIKVDLSPSQTLVQGGSGERLQNPSIQQSLEASKQQQQQPNVGKLATPPPILAHMKLIRLNYKLIRINLHQMLLNYEKIREPS